MRWTSLALVTFGLIVSLPMPARADKCSGAKLKAVGKKEAGLLACQAKVAAKNDTSRLAACESRVMGKFAAAFAKAGVCFGDQTRCENIADGCDSAMAAFLTDTFPSTCESSKRKAAGELASGELRCYAKAAAGLAVDTSCITKAQSKFGAAVGKAGACPDGGAPQNEVETNCVQPAVMTGGGGTVAGACPGCSNPTAPAGTVCPDDGNPCTVDACDGNGTCTHTAGNAGAVCRPSAGPCDVAETCSGTSSACPADVFVAAGTIYRPSAGECDPAETCSGTSAVGPPDVRSPAGTPCTSDGNPCTLDQCDGTNVTCQHPAGNAGAVCRAVAGACDMAEHCTGTSASCPADTLLAAGTVCRASAGICDVAETCTGTTAACPPDGFVAAGTACSAEDFSCRSGGFCSGTSASCPNGTFLPAGTVCRPALGVCDVAAICTGTSTNCPADGFVAAGTLCRSSTGACDPAEVCTGTSGACPADQLAAAGTVCRPAVDVCDVAETCTGTSASCPPNGFVSDGTACFDTLTCITGTCLTGSCSGTGCTPPLTCVAGGCQ